MDTKTKWIPASRGVRYYEHESRKYGKRKDRYYALSYKLDGKTVNEALGWESENRIPGQSLQSRAELLMAQLKENQRTGVGPRTLAEMRAANLKERQLQEAQEQEEKFRLVSLTAFFENEFVPFALRSKQEVSAKKEFSLFRLWIEPALGSLPVIEITFSEWIKLLKPMDKAGLSVATKRYVCGTLARILHLARDQGHKVDEIPTMKKLGLSQLENNRRRRVISDDELIQILNALREKNLCAYHIVVFGALTGCRFNEAASLTWGNVDESRGILFSKTKNKQPRLVPFSNALQEFFSYLTRQADTELVFKNGKGGKYGEAPTPFRDVIEALKLNENRDRLDRISYHSFRHTMATKLGSQLDLRSLMDTLGWKRVTMAARYMHGNDALKKNALDAVSVAIPTN